MFIKKITINIYKLWSHYYQIFINIIHRKIQPKIELQGSNSLLGSTNECYFILESGGGVGDANQRGDQYYKSHVVKVGSTGVLWTRCREVNGIIMKHCNKYSGFYFVQAKCILLCMSVCSLPKPRILQLPHLMNNRRIMGQTGQIDKAP